jgi:autotransporter-associated beta strand protein
LNGGTLVPEGGWGNTFSGLVTIDSNSTINADDGLTFSGNISGAGGFTKTGKNTLALTGTNSFTGASTIAAGKLHCNKAEALGSGALDISEGAKVVLNYTGTRTIAALTFKAGTALPPGTYGSTASPATNKNDTYFTGTGTVTILPVTTTGASPGGTLPPSPILQK